MKSKDGLIFEKYLITMARVGRWNYIQLPTGCRFLGRGKIIPIKSPFDFILQKDGRSIHCDAKSTQESTFQFNKINKNQVNDLLKLNPMVSGYIVEFREKDYVGFIHAKRLAEVKPGESIPYSETIFLGTCESFSLERVFQNVVTEERTKPLERAR